MGRKSPLLIFRIGILMLPAKHTILYFRDLIAAMQQHTEF
jgi:hypothetical protein